MNEALAYMNMPPEPLLEEPESDDCKAPAAKRPRKAHVVEEALNQGCTPPNGTLPDIENIKGFVLYV